MSSNWYIYINLAMNNEICVRQCQPYTMSKHGSNFDDSLCLAWYVHCLSILVIFSLNKSLNGNEL
jgi:hypothetical protein